MNPVSYCTSANGNQTQTYHRPIRQNKPIRQLRRLGCKPHRKNAAPIMPDNNHLPLPVPCVAINAIYRPDADDKLGQILQDIGRTVLLQAIAPTVTRQVHRNERRGALDRRRAYDMPPYSPAVRESVDEDDQGPVPRRAGLVVTDIVEFEAVAQRQELVRKTGPCV